MSRGENRLETDAAEGEETLPSNVLPLPRADALTVGADLRRAREAAGLSLAAVADRTKVRPGILTAIEEDAHDRLPALTYTIGFVKAYARTVGLDPDAAADRYRRESRKGEPVPMLVDVEPLEARRLPGPMLLWATGILVAVLLALLAAWGFGAFSGPLPDEPQVAAADPLPSASAPPALPGTPAGATAANPPAPADGPVRLTARDEVWIRVSDPSGGTRFFEGTLARGQSLDIPPGRPLVLRAGRAGALEVRVGGSLLPPLGGEGEVLAAQSLDPEALRTAAAPRGGLADAPPAP